MYPVTALTDPFVRLCLVVSGSSKTLREQWNFSVYLIRQLRYQYCSFCCLFHSQEMKSVCCLLKNCLTGRIRVTSGFGPTLYGTLGIFFTFSFKFSNILYGNWQIIFF
jgi:hypothetical protein